MILQNLTKYIQQADEAVFPSGIYCICCGSLIDGTRTYALCDTCIRRFHWNVGETCGKCGKALRRIDLGEGYEPEHFDEPGEGYEPEPVKDPGEGYGPELAADLIRTPAGKGGLGQDEAPELPAIGRPRLCYDCMREERLFRKGFSCLTYGLHERELMMALKYNGSGFIAVKCGDMMFDRIEEEVRDGLFAPGRNPIDLIAAVPVSASRYRKRGYNQSALMARQLVRRWKAFVREEKHKGSGSLPEEPRASDGTDPKNEDAEGPESCGAKTGTAGRVPRQRAVSVETARKACIADRRYIHHRRYCGRLQQGLARCRCLRSLSPDPLLRRKPQAEGGLDALSRRDSIRTGSV